MCILLMVQASCDLHTLTDVRRCHEADANDQDCAQIFETRLEEFDGILRCPQCEPGAAAPQDDDDDGGQARGEAALEPRIYDERPPQNRRRPRAGRHRRRFVNHIVNIEPDLDDDQEEEVPEVPIYLNLDEGPVRPPRRRRRNRGRRSDNNLFEMPFDVYGDLDGVEPFTVEEFFGDGEMGWHTRRIVEHHGPLLAADNGDQLFRGHVHHYHPHGHARPERYDFGYGHGHEHHRRSRARERDRDQQDFDEFLDMMDRMAIFGRRRHSY